jgi:hypothetical protein
MRTTSRLKFNKFPSGKSAEPNMRLKCVFLGILATKKLVFILIEGLLVT